jgi:ribosomal protein S4
MGGKLYVNGKEVTSGSTRIQPNDTVRIVAPTEYSGGGYNDDDYNSGSGSPGGSSGGLVTVIDNISARELGIAGMTVDQVLRAVAAEYGESISGLSEFRAEGGVLEINGTEVTNGSQRINASDRITVKIPGGEASSSGNGSPGSSSGNGSGVETIIDSITAQELGIAGMTVDQVLRAVAAEYGESISGLREFRELGGVLEINGREVTNGSTTIKASDRITVKINYTIETIEEAPLPDGYGGGSSGGSGHSEPIAVSQEDSKR